MSNLASARRVRRLSPSRMNDFLGCEYRTWLEIEVDSGLLEVERAHRGDAELLLEQGRIHEERFRAELVAAGADVVAVNGTDQREKAKLTEAAMAEGREVIHQACFLHDGWVGYADFLVRLDEPSARWDWSYEVHDAKLARHPKPNYIFQLLFYTEQVERIQGSRPQRMHLILGNGERPPFAPAEFDAYAAQVKAHFLERRTELEDGARPAYPYPVSDCDFCDFWKHCADKRRADDHLSLVATLQRGHGLALEGESVHTLTALAALPVDQHVPKLARQTLTGLVEQADLQLRSRGLEAPLHKLREPEHGRGLNRLPAPSAGDVFFDFEGDPYWGDDGLEYLFGSVFRGEAGEWTFWPLWAHDRQGERRAFETWMHWITERLARYPDLHVFHFNHYEPTALKKLMSRYGSCEHEVDELLRRGVFVDLYSVVRQSMRVGTERYGLKWLEALYAFERVKPLGGIGAARSYEQWRETQDPAVLDEIATYNADDCHSTRAFYGWLLERRPEAEAEFGLELDALQPEPERELSDKQRERLARIDGLRDALTVGLPEDEDAWDDEQRTRARVADLLDYHRREAKPVWWAFFARLGVSPEDLCAEDAEAIGCLEPAPGVMPESDKKSMLHPLRFPEQHFKIAAGDKVHDPETGKGVTLARLDEDARIAWIKIGPSKKDDPLPKALIPGGPYDTTAQQDALARHAERVLAHGTGPAGGLDAATDLVAARAPRLRLGTPPLTGGPVDLPRLCDQVAGLDDSVMFLQGPPGTGKTYTGGRLAADLMRRGRRVGVTATSHKAISKLLEEIDEAADGVAFRGYQKCGDPDAGVASDRIEVVDALPAGALEDPEVLLVAGTAWLWAREDCHEKVDVLFIDEAGQMSLADAIAVAQAAKSVVLLGDPQQLAHVSQGTHPHGSGCSVLEHLLGDRDTVAADRGVFLDRTWRMHPDVCAFVSQTMYDDRLEPIAGLGDQVVDAPGLSGAGLRFLEVEHADNRISSKEEAAVVAAEVDKLLAGGRWRDRHGDWHPITLNDILVVAPFNAQVRCLKRRLPDGARVGTVDKFQGQEAPVVFFSMACSSGEDVPRGMDFLFSRNRLNVAVSRAQVLAAVVCSPRLLRTRTSSVDQMRLVNMLCRFAGAAT